MRILLDTNVLSELWQPTPNPRVVHRVATIKPGDSFVSAISIGEIVFGINLMPASARKRGLLDWLGKIESDYDGRILPIDINVSRIWGVLSASCQIKGHRILPQDGLIAATALRHGLQLMTRNIKDFVHTGVLLINPWEE